MLGMAKTLNKTVKGKLSECSSIEISLQNKKNNSRKQGGGYRVTGHFVIKRRIITKIMRRTYNRKNHHDANDKNTHTSLEKYLSIIPKASL